MRPLAMRSFVTRSTIEASEASDDILCISRLRLEVLTIINNSLDNLVHIVCLVRVLRDDLVE